jgi:3-isopropylmalate/(R)-2-methylmalate dehydratase large subunit
MSLTLYDKLWQTHVVTPLEDGLDLIYIDRHLLHEVTSPQAFEGLAQQKRLIWRRSANLAVPDHNVPTTNRDNIEDPLAREQIQTLDKNCQAWDIPEFTLSDIRQGIVHIVGPEQGATLPGMTIVCGDSHTSTHGAFATIAMGIGTSDVEHVLATQCLMQRKMKNMRVSFTGQLGQYVSAKDMILDLIGQIGTAGGTGYAIEFSGPLISQLSMEERMTICNMTIEAGARCGLIAVDQTTIDYIQNKPFAPKGKDWDDACEYWQGLCSDSHAHFDLEVSIDVSKLKPQVTWGTSPEMVVSVKDKTPNPKTISDLGKRRQYDNALKYMGLQPDVAIESICLDKIFIGSCTNARIEDLRIAAEVVRGHTIAQNIKQAMVVPGSGLIKQQAEAEGLDKIFITAGFEWRQPGCSMCLGMNPDQLSPQERCAATSNRNFEGRQGYLGRTHLVSPAMAAAAAIAGHFVDVSADVLEEQAE